MNTAVKTALQIHIAAEWHVANRRYAFKALAEAAPKDLGVICINRPLDLTVAPVKSAGKFWRGIWSTKVTVEAPGVWIVTPRILLHEQLAAKLPGITSWNRVMLRGQIRKTLSRVFPRCERLIQWIHHPHQRWVLGAFPDAGTVYHVFDEYTCRSNGTFVANRWEQEIPLLREADLTFATSGLLIDRRRDVARRIRFLPSGIPDFFLNATPVPADPLDEIPQPRILYLGSFYEFLDYSLLEQLFRRRPDWHLVMIGAERSFPGVAELKRLDNVHLAGRRKIETLPGIMDRFKVAIMPFVHNDYSRVADPLKLYAYMAAGIPVVATPLVSLKSKSAYIRQVPNEPEAFESAIGAILAEDQSQTRERLREEASKRTWSRIARDIVIPELREVFQF